MNATPETVEIPAWRRQLVYIDYRDNLSPDDVDKLIHGDWPADTDEWISEAQWTSASELADEIIAEEDFEATDENHDLLVERLIDLDTSDPYRDLLRNTGHMLFRFSPDEDHSAFLSDELDDPLATLQALDLPPEFLPAVTEILPEIQGYQAEGGAFFGATFVFSANPADLFAADPSGQITISDPFLWLTNPWAGNGYGVVAEGTSITLPLADVHVDSRAWGYGANDVFGGLILPDSTVSIPEPQSTTT